MNIQGWFPLGLTSLISLLSNGLSRVISSTTAQKHQFPWLIHVNVWQKPLQYCKVISLQLNKIKNKNKSISSSVLNLLYGPALTSIHDYWKNHSFDYMGLCISKVMSLLFNMMSRLVITFLPRSKSFLLSWPQSLYNVQRSKFPPHVFIFSSFCPLPSPSQIWPLSLSLYVCFGSMIDLQYYVSFCYTI